VTVNDRPVACNGVVGLRAGDRLTVHPPERGLRTYVAAPGGFVAPDVLGSASGTPIETGDVLESRTAMELAARHLADPPTSLSGRPLRALVVRDGWLDAAYGVGRTLDRVGLRLEGPKPMVDARSGTSEPSVSGAVQLTEDRTLIVHGPDGPTIGGYVKLGFIVTADLDRTAQLAPGDRVEFRAVSLDEARGLRAEHQKTLQALVRRVATAGGGPS
jgi:allophanate hydrolase subunit 2